MTDINKGVYRNTRMRQKMRQDNNIKKGLASSKMTRVKRPAKEEQENQKARN